VRLKADELLSPSSLLFSKNRKVSSALDELIVCFLRVIRRDHRVAAAFDVMGPSCASMNPSSAAAAHTSCCQLSHVHQDEFAAKHAFRSLSIVGATLAGEARHEYS
jgi:hypothetical protein